jgi:transcriptional regulator with XRE-family HTH domain
MSLGSRLKKEREKRNWSQVYVAKKIGISNAVLSNYERDYRDPDTETLKKLALLYGVKTDYLLGLTDDPSPSEEKEYPTVIRDPELERWHKELPKSDEEDLRKLRQMWKIMKGETE